MIYNVQNPGLTSTPLVMISLWLFNYKEINYFLCLLLAPESKKEVSMFFKTLFDVCLDCVISFSALSPLECKACPAGTEPALGFEYKWWNILPGNMKTSCFNVGNSKCDGMNGEPNFLCCVPVSCMDPCCIGAPIKMSELLASWFTEEFPLLKFPVGSNLTVSQRNKKCVVHQKRAACVKFPQQRPIPPLALIHLQMHSYSHWKKHFFVFSLVYLIFCFLIALPIEVTHNYFGKLSVCNFILSVLRAFSLHMC